MLDRSPGAALVVLLAFAALPPAASAAEQTFCVADPACSGTPAATVADALAAAQANGPERDRIKVGPGTFTATSTLMDASDNPVLIEGDGEAATVLTRSPVAGETILLLGNPQSGISRLTVHIPGQVEMIGISLTAGAFGERLRITSTPATADAIGIQVQAGSSLRRSVVTLPNATAAGNTGIDAGGTVVVESVGASATHGVILSGSGALIRTARITGRTGIEFFGAPTGNVTAAIENTQVNSLSPAAGDAAVIARAFSMAAHTTTLNVRHTTLIGPGSGTGFQAVGQATGPNPTATLNVLDSVVRAYSTDLQGLAGPSGTSAINIDNSAFDLAKQSTNTNQATINPGPNNINLNGVDPRLRDFQGDMRPGFDSPLVDRGVPGGLLSTESPLDLALLARVIDGNGDGTARRDMGAFEYQRAAPQVTASAAPATAGQRQPITFSASATDSDPEESPGEISWSFDDGTTATGASVQHAFASAGPHTATATATDPAGAAGTATASVIITDAAAPELVISGRAVTLTRRGVAAVGLTCPATEISGPCAGRLTIRTARRLERPGATRARRIKLGSARFRIPAGRTRKVKVRLSRANRRLVAVRRRVRVAAVAAVRDQVGNSSTVTGRFQLRARRRSASR